jgi:hypothetical protein
MAPLSSHLPQWEIGWPKFKKVQYSTLQKGRSQKPSLTTIPDNPPSNKIPKGPKTIYKIKNRNFSILKLK